MFVVMSKSSRVECEKYRKLDKPIFYMWSPSPKYVELYPFEYKCDAVKKATELAESCKKDYEVFHKICTATASCSVNLKCEEN